MAKYFTREEAEALLPQIEPLLLELQERHQSLQPLRQELEALQQRMRGNGHGLHDHLERLNRQYAALLEEVNQLIRRIYAFGCQIKDPAMGLIDFPALRNGEEILLCWRLGEEGIHWWHDTTSGFAGRQPLD
ncbi:MAG TPA: DUF2203 domain-containing protein [Ktedonobacterales bacterium]|nr:DUF2203 domain-containing protein [Ktedonobacterales bacterium]